MLQSPPLQLVHEVFGEFLSDAASIQPLPDTFDFVLEICTLLADFYPDERTRQQLFTKRFEVYLDRPIYTASLANGVTATDGSLVDSVTNPEVGYCGNPKHGRCRSLEELAVNLKP